MAIYTLDSSALLKAYVEEKGSSHVASILGSQIIVASSLVVTEIGAALARRAHLGEISSDRAREGYEVFMIHTRERMTLVDLEPRLLRRAAEMCFQLSGTVMLRSLDAIHLATAEESFILARQAGVPVGTILTDDARMLAAAAALDIPAERPTDPPERA